MAPEDTGDGGEAVTEGPDMATALKSVVLLSDGCTAAKVGDRHLLVAARCVNGNAAFAAGKTINFKQAAGATQNGATLKSSAQALTGDDDDDDTFDASVITDPEAPDPSDPTAIPDASPDVITGSTTTPGSSPSKKVTKTNKSTTSATIESVNIHSSFAAKCPGTQCAFGAAASAEAKDIAVIVLDANLISIPTLPVDLDTVEVGHSVYMVGSGCSKFDGTPSTVKAAKATVMPAKSVQHTGSSFVSDQGKAEVANLDDGYVITPGPGWKDQGSSNLCKNDVGAPLFRDSATLVIAGVTSNYTTFDPTKNVPVTVEHTRVDTRSNVGTWLTSLGVSTAHACKDGSCTKSTTDAGIPSPNGTTGTTGNGTTPSDAGKDALAPDAGDAGKDKDKTTTPPDPATDQHTGETQLGQDDPTQTPGPNDGSNVDAGPPKDKKKAGGCSTTPGEAPGSGLPLAFGVGLALAAVLKRRRQS
jgi:MYXO-CTERM domain-containing protein